MDDETKPADSNNSSREDEIQATVDKLLLELAEDYRNYLNFDISKEQGKYYESIEGMLTKLDEFCGLVDLIRSDTNLCLNTTLPKIDEKCEEMRLIFDRIDKLVQFVDIVKENVNIMEERVSQAEKDVGDSIGSGLMKKLSSIMGSKKAKEKKKVEYNEPVIFNTDDYFPKDNTVTVTQNNTHDNIVTVTQDKTLTQDKSLTHVEPSSSILTTDEIGEKQTTSSVS